LDGGNRGKPGGELSACPYCQDLYAGSTDALPWGGGSGGDISVEFSLVAESNKLLAGDAAMGEIPTVEVAVAVGFGRIGDGG
jgi:hypothetical protein